MGRLQEASGRASGSAAWIWNGDKMRRGGVTEEEESSRSVTVAIQRHVVLFQVRGHTRAQYNMLIVHLASHSWEIPTHSTQLTTSGCIERPHERMEKQRMFRLTWARRSSNGAANWTRYVYFWLLPAPPRFYGSHESEPFEQVTFDLKGVKCSITTSRVCWWAADVWGKMVHFCLIGTLITKLYLIIN